MFPDVPVNMIEKDLELTFSGEVTINRILDGQIYQQGVPNHSNDDYHSDDELPEIPLVDINNKERKQRENTQISCEGSSVVKHTSISTTKPSFVSPDTNNLVLPNIRQDFLSDNSGSEDDCIPELKSGKSVRKNLSNTIVTAVSTSCAASNYSDILLTRPPLASELSQGFDQRSERLYNANNKANKGRKRTQEEVEDSRRKAVVLKEETKRKKEDEKLRKQQEREQKKREQEFEKQKKKTLMEARKQAKPGECLKFMTVILSPGMLKETSGAAILDTLQRTEIKYDIQPQIHDNILTLWREVSEIKEVEPMKLQSVTTEKIEDCVLMILPVSKFITLVYNYKQKQLGLSIEEDLHEHITVIKGSLEGRDVTVIVQGLDKYFRLQKTKENRAFKKLVQGSESGTSKKSKKQQENVAVSRLDVEEALVHLQLFDGCNIRFIEDDQDVAKLVKQYIKSVAETPFKRDRLQTGFSFHLDSSRSAAVDRDGVGLANAWRLQLQQFPLVTAEVANTIMAAYTSPLNLMKAYKKCESTKQAERLLENLEVRRGAGVMATSRRVGKELSRRVYQFYTCSDPDFVIP